MSIETKTYNDGTTATGPAPLPDRSPRQQEEGRPSCGLAGEGLPTVAVSAIHWVEAPNSTHWGAGMMLACVALDKDSILDLCCHKDDIRKVAAALTRVLPAIQDISAKMDGPKAQEDGYVQVAVAVPCDYKTADGKLDDQHVTLVMGEPKPGEIALYRRVSHKHAGPDTAATSTTHAK